LDAVGASANPDVDGRSLKGEIMNRLTVIALVLLVAGYCTASHAASVFFDDFEGDLSQWTGKSGGSHHGQIVEDPLDPSNSVLNFTETVAGGDIFQSPGLSTVPGGKMLLSFDYFGESKTGDPDGGGFIGIASASDASHVWLAGTNTTSGADPILKATDAWEHHEIFFDARYSTSRVMIEDFVDPARNAYFDNVRLASVPFPAAAWGGLALLGGMGGVAGLRRKLRGG
jgi:hypothetical protein